MKRRWLLKIIKIGGPILLVLLIVAAAIIWQSENDTAVIEKYVKNENLPDIRSGWQGTPVDEKGRFVNDEYPYLPKVSDILKWQFSGNPQREEKENDPTRLSLKDPTEFLSSDKNGILWLGHASFFIRLNGINIITDPIFGKPPFIKTYVDVPSPLDKIRKIDYLLLSHDHRDHTDEETIKQICRKFPNAVLLSGLKMDDLLNVWKTETNELQTAGWYQQFSLKDEKVKIFFLPTRHWSRRALFDTNQRLWGSFVIQGANQIIYFGSDSGYGSHYKQLAELFPQIDYFLVGIGAYRPRWFMKANHNSPEDALQGFIDSKAKIMIPMHFGRFDLSDEPPGEPLKLLRENAAQLNLSDRIKVYR